MSEASEIEAATEAREARVELTADQWEAIAAAQQRRLFAIYDLAMAIEPDLRTIAAGFQTDGEKIRDLCRLPQKELVTMGLLKAPG